MGEPGGLPSMGSHRIGHDWSNLAAAAAAAVYIIGEGNGTPLQYSCLGNPVDGGAWWAAVHGVTKSWTWLSDFTFTFHFHALEKEMATHSSVLAWRTPGTGEPRGLPSLGSHRVGHDWSDLAAAAAIQSNKYLQCYTFIFSIVVKYEELRYAICKKKLITLIIYVEALRLVSGFLQEQVGNLPTITFLVKRK